MATKVYFINSTLAQYTDAEFSLIQTELLKAGIFGDKTTGALGLGVTQRAAGANMSVDVAIGKALVELTKTSVTWKVAFENTAIVNVAIASNASGSNRVDAIVIRIDKDTDPNLLKTNIGTIERVAGTGVSALTDGAITTALGSDGWYRLADVTVANGAVSILNANITDTRVKVLTSEAVSFKDNYSNVLPPGAVIDYTGKVLPNNFLWPDGSAVSRATYANLFANICNPKVFTVTIATPGVFTLTGHGFVAGDQISFTTTGGLPAGLAVNTTYYVISTGLTANTFRVALSPEGTAVNTSGSQSGIHTLYFSNFGKGDGSTTFNLPDLRSVTVVGRGDVAPNSYLDFEPAAVTIATDSIATPSFIDFPYQGQKIRLTSTGTLPAGLSLATDYYVVRVSSTSIKLATSQANANANTPVVVDISGQGTGVHTIVFTNVVRSILGLRTGEDTHGMSVSEMPSHDHDALQPGGVGGGAQAGSGSATGSTYQTGARGGNSRSNLMQPNVVLNKIIKY